MHHFSYGSGALNTGLKKTDSYEHNVWYVWHYDTCKLCEIFCTYYNVAIAWDFEVTTNNFNMMAMMAEAAVVNMEMVMTTITTKPATGLGHTTICCEGQCAGLWAKLHFICLITNLCYCSNKRSVSMKFCNRKVGCVNCAQNSSLWRQHQNISTAMLPNLCWEYLSLHIQFLQRSSWGWTDEVRNM